MRMANGLLLGMSLGVCFLLAGCHQEFDNSGYSTTKQATGEQSAVVEVPRQPQQIGPPPPRTNATSAQYVF
jgi:hypothetical protein